MSRRKPQASVVFQHHRPSNAFVLTLTHLRFLQGLEVGLIWFEERFSFISNQQSNAGATPFALPLQAVAGCRSFDLASHLACSKRWWSEKIVCLILKLLTRYLSCLSCLCQIRKARLIINNSNNTVSIPPVLIWHNDITIWASYQLPYLYIR